MLNEAIAKHLYPNIAGSKVFPIWRFTAIRFFSDGGTPKQFYESLRAYCRTDGPREFSAEAAAIIFRKVMDSINSATISPAEQRHRCQAGVQPHSGQGCPITPPRVGESTPGNETPSRGSVVTAPGPRRSTTTERLEPAQSRDLEGQ